MRLFNFLFIVISCTVASLSIGNVDEVVSLPGVNLPAPVVPGTSSSGEGRRLTTTTVETQYMWDGYDNTIVGHTLVLVGDDGSNAGTYTGTKLGSDHWQDQISKDITMECAEGVTCYVDGQNDHRCLYIRSSTVTVTRFTIQNGKVDHGGGIYVSMATVTCIYVVLNNNVASVSVSKNLELCRNKGMNY